MKIRMSILEFLPTDRHDETNGRVFAISLRMSRANATKKPISRFYVSTVPFATLKSISL